MTWSLFASDFSPAVAGSFHCNSTESALLLCQHTLGECCDDEEKAGVMCEYN